MDNEDVAYLYNGILLRHKKHEIKPFAAKWMDLEIIILGEVRQTKTNIKILLICGISENDMNELKYV